MSVEPLKFLLVDDLEENLLALDALLRREGLELLKARSGPEALELLLVHEVALAIIDVQMPEMDGFQLAELMRGTERTRRVPIIFVTAGSRDERRAFRGYETGAVDFLYKPLDPHVLRSKAGVFFEIQLQKRQLAAQLQAAKQLREFEEQLLGIASHDLRNPLNAILLTAATMKRRGGLDAQGLKMLERISSAGARATRIVHDLLDFTQARLGGGIRLERRVVDFHRIVKDVVQELEAAHPERSVRLSERGEAEGAWDPDRLAQVVSNLGSNALKYSPGESLVQMESVAEAEGVRLHVHNVGAPIPPERLPRIFEPFERGTDEQGGANRSVGLGLYITKQIVEAHGGKLEVRSTREEGTSFQVWLPRAEQARA